jgi:endonuclease/exonuclease/phosphatase family metal-dependent hydrolase
MPLRIATYNIHRCIGRDGTESPERVAAVLREIGADVVALQEVAHRPGSPDNVLAVLAESIDAEAIDGTTLHDNRGNYGNALLTRVAPESVRRWDISVPLREPRGALDVVLAANDSTVRVVTTHLGLRAAERRGQIRRLLSLLEAGSTDVTVLMGDFNEWYWWGRPLRWLNRTFGAMPSPATFPSHRPFLALDRMWVRPRQKLISLSPHRSALARTASDHLPLVAVLAL